MNSVTSVQPALRLPPPLLVAWTLSVLAHVALLTGGAAQPFVTLQPGAMREMQVTLTISTTLPALARQRSPAVVMSTATATHTATASGVAQDAVSDPSDAPLVASRYDVATLQNPKPPYPLAARRQGVEGRVLLRAQVLEDGRCAEARIVRSSGHAVLDESALATVRRWRFLPATRAGMPVASWVEVPIAFRLDVASGDSALHAAR
jgi:TonB family protein